MKTQTVLNDRQTARHASLNKSAASRAPLPPLPQRASLSAPPRVTWRTPSCTKWKSCGTIVSDMPEMLTEPMWQVSGVHGRGRNTPRTRALPWELPAQKFNLASNWADSSLSKNQKEVCGGLWLGMCSGVSLVGLLRNNSLLKHMP